MREQLRSRKRFELTDLREDHRRLSLRERALFRGAKVDYQRSSFSSLRSACSNASRSSSLKPKWWANSWITVARMLRSSAPRVRLTRSIGRRKILTTLGERSPQDCCVSG